MTIREQIEARERELLSPLAARASESRGRETEEGLDPLRTCYMRDRDRILHSKPFRRLKHKTQVFIAPIGDHYRTRLTHTLEVAQVARTISRALRLNEDLTEAIALGHDVGHPPFGHAGERALDEVLKLLPEGEPGPRHFRHYEHSLRVLDELSPLNLSWETRAGIGGHSKGRNDLSAHDGEPTSTLEAAVVRISDRIAYLNHDWDDAVRSGIVGQEPKLDLLKLSHGQRISLMVTDVVRHSVDQPAIQMSAELLDQLNVLKEWLFVNVYEHYPELNHDVDKAERLVCELFLWYWENGTGPNRVQDALDYVAGMTDRFALADFTAKMMPMEFVTRASRIP